MLDQASRTARLILLFCLSITLQVPWIVYQLCASMKPIYGEAVDEYWCNQYVTNREGYDYGTQLTHDTAALLSSPDVQQKYY